jgi:hypothetical protein
MLGGLFNIIIAIIISFVARSLSLFFLIFGGLYFFTGVIFWRRERKSLSAKKKIEEELQKRKQLKQQSCPNCGTKLDLGSLYCWKCGSKITEKANSNLEELGAPLDVETSLEAKEPQEIDASSLICPNCRESINNAVLLTNNLKCPKCGKPVAQCNYHETAAVARCSKCGMYLCEKCTNINQEQNYCKKCYSEVMQT